MNRTVMVHRKPGDNIMASTASLKCFDTDSLMYLGKCMKESPWFQYLRELLFIGTKWKRVSSWKVYYLSKSLVLKLWLPICTIFMFSFWRVQFSLYAPWLLAVRRIPIFFPLEEMLGFEVGPRKAKEARKHLQMEIISILKIGQPDFFFFLIRK